MTKTVELHAEIRQNNQPILRGDETSIPMIFNNLTGKNFQGKEYRIYIKNVALKDMGFEYGIIEYYENNKLIETGTIKNN